MTCSTSVTYLTSYCSIIWTFSTINVSIRYEIKLVSCRSRDLRLSAYAHCQNILAQEQKSKKKYAHYQYTLPSDLTK